ncbi:MAG: hypothetical protein ABI144_03895 [Gallionella sp.]
MRNLPPNSTNIPGPFRNLLAVVATAAVFGLALMFSVVVVAIILVAGTIAWGYLWWRTRELRKQMRNYPPPGMMREGEMAEEDVIRGEVIEGEAVHVTDTREDR